MSLICVTCHEPHGVPSLTRRTIPHNSCSWPGGNAALPGILPCRLWHRLRESAGGSTREPHYTTSVPGVCDSTPAYVSHLRAEPVRGLVITVLVILSCLGPIRPGVWWSHTCGPILLLAMETRLLRKHVADLPVFRSIPMFRNLFWELLHVVVCAHALLHRKGSPAKQQSWYTSPWSS